MCLRRVMSKEPNGETAANVSVIAVIFLVTLTVVSASSLFVAVTEFGIPEPDYPPFEEETSPFAVEFVEGTLGGNSVETALYDSTTGEESEYVFDGNRKSPPSAREGVADTISSLKGSPSFPSGFGGGELRVPSGEYYVETDETRIGLGDKIVFDTTDGPVKIAVAESGSLSVSANFEVEGSHPVEFYVSRSNVFGNDLYVFDSDFENRRTSAVRIYAQPDAGGDSSDIKVENTEFRGVVYAPGTTVKFKDSTARGASIAEETVLDNSSYYHDTHLERLGEDALP